MESFIIINKHLHINLYSHIIIWSPLLLVLVNMILEGPSIKDQIEDTKFAALSIAQLLKFNGIKHKCTQDTIHSVTVRHATAQETPYIGLHAHIHKEELVYRLYYLGINMSFSRDR